MVKCGIDSLKPFLEMQWSKLNYLEDEPSRSTMLPDMVAPP